MVLRQVNRARRGGLVVLAMLAATLAWAPPASAACHLAAFVDSEATVGEADGTVTLTVELQGRQPTCSGTVEYETRDGTATSGADYEAQSGELTFVAADDRVEDIVVPITSDGEAEDDETFTVVLTGASGSISVGSPDTATVTIVDDDEAQPDPTEAATTDGGQPTTEPATESTTPADEPTEVGTTQPGPVTTELADDEDGGVSAGVIALIVLAAIAVLGLGGWAVMRSRQG